MNIDLSTCSERFLRGVKWLEKVITYDERIIRKRIQKYEDKRSTSIRDSLELDDLKKKLEIKYTISEVEAIYVLGKSGLQSLDNDFSIATNNEEFWDYSYIFDDPQALWFLKELGLDGAPHYVAHINDIIKRQTVEGLISDTSKHCGVLRTMVSVRPDSRTVSDAVDFFLNNWKSPHHFYVDDIATGILALTELNFPKYQAVMNEQTNYLKDIQNSDGSWEEHQKVRHTSYAIWAISRIHDVGDISLVKGLDWLGESQLGDGSWGGEYYSTAYALLGLLAMGEGPKAPLEPFEFELTKMRQKLKKQKPTFMSTSPLYKGSLHVKEIYEKILNMLHSAKKEIRIASLFIDMLYEEIISLAKEETDLIVKIITRPKREVEGTRGKIAKNVIDLLNIATKGNVVQSDVVHSRMIIIDDKEVLVSSADLTRDQLFDEFNAGIWTSDEEAVKKATEFFDNLFDLEKQNRLIDNPDYS